MNPQCFSGVNWIGGEDMGDTFVNQITNDDVIDELMAQIGTVVEGRSSL